MEQYTPGGYSWLAVAPESKIELEIEKLEEQIYELRKKYEKTKDEQLLKEIDSLKEQIKQKNHSH